MPVILRQQGYVVTAVGTVNEALTQITTAPFDVLISDLNIGHPGDGFTVVSAMRRTQPKCITLILTGYPGFDSALEAIRSQVDDYLIKPAVIPSLIKLIEEKLKNPKPGTAPATKRISQILRENVFEITQRALRGMKSNPALAAIPLTDEQRIEFIPRAISSLTRILESDESGEPEVIQGANVHGLQRYKQGYTVPLLVPCVRSVEHAIYEVIHENLLSLNLSYFVFDLRRLSTSLSLLLEHTQMSFLSAEQRIGRKAGQQS